MKNVLIPFVIVASGCGLAGSEELGSSQFAVWEFTETNQLEPANGTIMGQDVDSYAWYSVVGGLSSDGSRGEARIFEAQGWSWVEIATLSAQAGEDLGLAVTLDGNRDGYTVALGGQQQDVVRVYTRNGATWTEQATLTPSDGPLADLSFGATVDLHDNTLVVGAWDPDKLVAGAVYVFVRDGSTWTEQAKLVAPGFDDHGAYGTAVAVDGDTILVGSPAENQARGAVHVWSYDGWFWSPQVVLTGTNPGDQFGTAVAIHDDISVIGAIGDDGGASDSGAAYVYQDTGSTWTQAAKLTYGDAATGDGFGAAVATRWDVVTVSAPHHNQGQGAAYCFASGSSWAELVKLEASDGAADDALGASAAMNGGMVMLGAPHRDNDAGGAYLYDLFMTPAP